MSINTTQIMNFKSDVLKLVHNNEINEYTILALINKYRNSLPTGVISELQNVLDTYKEDKDAALILVNSLLSTYGLGLTPLQNVKMNGFVSIGMPSVPTRGKSVVGFNDEFRGIGYGFVKESSNPKTRTSQAKVSSKDSGSKSTKSTKSGTKTTKTSQSNLSKSADRVSKSKSSSQDKSLTAMKKPITTQRDELISELEEAVKPPKPDGAHASESQTTILHDVLPRPPSPGPSQSDTDYQACRNMEFELNRTKSDLQSCNSQVSQLRNQLETMRAEAEASGIKNAYPITSWYGLALQNVDIYLGEIQEATKQLSNQDIIEANKVISEITEIQTYLQEVSDMLGLVKTELIKAIKNNGGN